MAPDKPSYRVLATDYDGTLAENGKVSDATIDALIRLREAKWKLVMVTGREIADLSKTFDRFDLFDIIVGENGGLLYFPKDKFEQRLADPPPPTFVERLVERGVGPISVGHCIVATWEPHQNAVLEVIHDMQLELQVIFNKGAVMVLPSTVNKASGLQAALEHLKIKPVDVVGVGDAENDHAFLDYCGHSVAVANALDSLKKHAKQVTVAGRGEGVVELIDGLLAATPKAKAKAKK